MLDCKKETIKIIMGIRNRDSCREYFRKLKILPLHSQYILSLSLFLFATNIILSKIPSTQQQY